jgi:hypothetical protein
VQRRIKVLAVAAGTVVAMGGLAAGVSVAAPSHGPFLTDVPTANAKADGFSPASRLSPELRQVVIAQGSTKVENPSALVSYYGYYNDTLNAAGTPQMLPTPASLTEAQKSEPDKNTYLVFRHGLPGADPGYYYGSHFLFQGHELGAGGNSFISRINLDADAAHRVTVLATTDSAGQPIAPIDGSTWDPWARRLIFTTENASAPTYSATPGYPSVVTDISGALGRGGYEGVQNDSDGNLWIVEDIGGSGKSGTTARIPNSFLYRYVPARPGDLANGKLQVLQVLNAGGDPVTQASQTPLNSPDQVALHTFGTVLTTKWVTIHDTAVDGTAPFNANTLAKAANGTPFKRPENGQFQPGSDFRNFYFVETGDTSATTPEAATAGGLGAILKLSQRDPSASTGKITLFYRSDVAHSGMDNVTFLSRTLVTFVEDAGDTLHGQRNALDSGYVFDTTVNYSDSASQPVRWLAEGRDPSATIDSAFGGFGKNEGDNEITGVHVSNGDPSIAGILGGAVPDLKDPDWRWFYTQQHGDNPTYEVLYRG